MNRKLIQQSLHRSAFVLSVTPRRYRYIKRAIDRPLRPTDLYMAHFLGAGGAKEFLVALENEPAAPAASLSPSAAKANKAVFYASGSRSRSVREVHSLFQQKIEDI